MLASGVAGRSAPHVKKLAPLFVLYFSQGLPFGFQATAFPLLLRERGASLTTVGFSGLLALPWLTKALWAPVVDRFFSPGFGRRKSWIVPMQGTLVVLCALAAHTRDLRTLALLILAMNFCAATQDIAVDALAVSLIGDEDLGPLNALQVVGYKLGMLTGGGLLVWASARIGWSGLFYAMAGLMFAVLLSSLMLREGSPSTSLSAAEPRIGFRALWTRLREALRRPDMAALIAVVITYKMGESMADSMWKPLLLDRGFESAEIGLWAGTFGMVFSLLGSSGAGILAKRTPLARALLWIAVVRALGVGAEWWIASLSAPGASAVIAVTCVEHLVGGAITTIMFALMMQHTDREIGATHYTLLASLEVWGKLPLGALSGFIAQRFGYQALFASATVLCVAFAWLAQVVAPNLRGQAARAH
jgi:PAT family beta-lactamase induction signal transducer AmpG